MLFFISFLMFYFSYLFSVMFLAFLIMMFMVVSMSGIFYLKYLVIMVYVSGVVVFILYISCMCWFSSNKFNMGFILLALFMMFLFDSGNYSKLSDIGEYLWMYLFFSFLFNSLITSYSLNLFKVAGSLRF